MPAFFPSAEMERSFTFRGNFPFLPLCGLSPFEAVPCPPTFALQPNSWMVQLHNARLAASLAHGRKPDSIGSPDAKTHLLTDQAIMSFADHRSISYPMRSDSVNEEAKSRAEGESLAEDGQ